VPPYLTLATHTCVNVYIIMTLYGFDLKKQSQPAVLSSKLRRRDTQHNDIQQNVTQLNRLVCDTRHK
jgi:hypothetical protein